MTPGHQVLLFRLGQRVLAVAATHTREVFEREHLTRLPLGRDVLLGLSAVHGRAVPVINLAWLLREPEPQSALTLLAEVEGQVIALPVEELLGLAHLPLPEAPSPELLAEPVPFGGHLVFPLQLSALVRAVQAQLTLLS